MDPTMIVLARHQKDVCPREILRHTMRYAELTVLLSGEMKYFAGDREIPLHGGDVLYLPKNTLRARSEAKEKADYLSFNFLTDEPVALPTVIPGGVTREIRYLASLFDEMIRNRYSENAAEKTEHLLRLFLLALEDDLRAQQTHPVVRKVNDYLRRHLADRVTLSDAAAQCFLSPVYCDTLYKQETGASIIETLLALRLEEAKLLLMQGQESMSGIAALTGFRDANYFARFFKKRVGVTPSAYRARSL